MEVGAGEGEVTVVGTVEVVGNEEAVGVRWIH